MTFRIVGIGEVLWDMLPAGAQLGGAPANFAFHANALGATSCIVSRVGDDALGHEIIARLTALGLTCEGIQRDAGRPTGTVAVTIADDGQPQFDIRRDVAWDGLEATDVARRAVAVADAICFGTLAQRAEQSRGAIRELLRAAPSASIRVLDVNLRQHYHSPELIDGSLALATVLKVNDAELPQLAAMFGLAGSVKSQIDAIMARWQLRALAYTRGDRGSLLRTADAWSEHPGVPTTVVDTVGAGDAFTAAMTLGFLNGWALDDINARANAIASYVASQAGGTPPLPAGLVAAFA